MGEYKFPLGIHLVHTKLLSGRSAIDYVVKDQDGMIHSSFSRLACARSIVKQQNRIWRKNKVKA